MVSYNRFRSVAVVAVKIPNRNAFSVALQRIQRGDSGIAEVTETHRAIARSVMARRPHQAKCAPALQRHARCLNRRASRAARMRRDIWVKRRVAIKIVPRVSNALDVLTGVRAQQLIIDRCGRLTPFPIRVALL